VKNAYNEADKEYKAAKKALQKAKRAYEWTLHEGDAFRVSDSIKLLW